MVTNYGTEAVNISEWVLKDKYDPGQSFTFPSEPCSILAPGQSVTIYTDEKHPPCNFSFNSGRAIWNNDGDTAVLINIEGEEVSTYSYS